MSIDELVDNGTTRVTVGHVFQSDFKGNRGRDKCHEMFGEETNECREYNKKFNAPNL